MTKLFPALHGLSPVVLKAFRWVLLGPECQVIVMRRPDELVGLLGLEPRTIRF